MPTFNVLIATIARPTLQRMLDSLKPQLVAEDCLTLVFDGRTAPSWLSLDRFSCKIVIHEEPTALGHWGHGIRNKYAPLLEQRDFVMHGDDDDIYTEGTFAYLREKCTNRGCLYVGKMHINPRLIVPVPGPNPIRIGNIGTPNGIIPHELNKMGIWKPICGGDGEFYISIAPKASSVALLDKIIYWVRP